MGDGVLDVCSQLCKRLVVAVGHEQGVIAKACGAALLGGNGAVDTTLEEVLLGGGAGGLGSFCAVARFFFFGGFCLVAILCQQQGYDGAEVCCARCLAVELAQKLLHVCLRVVVSAFGVACAVNAGCSVERVDLQARVVSKDAHVVMVPHILCLLQGVALQRVGGLGDVGMAAYVGKRHHLHAAAEDLAYLLQLVEVVGCKYNLFHLLFFCFVLGLFAFGAQPMA